jgi:hypothetical protein
MEVFIEGFDVLRRLARALGPYLLLELLLPGGTMFALFLFLYRRRAAIREVAAQWKGAGTGIASWYPRTIALYRACVAMGANSVPERS